MEILLSNQPPTYAATICHLGLKNQRLIAQSLDYGLVGQAKELMIIDRELERLLWQKAAFDFVGHIATGQTLLVGEGNLSFTTSLTRKRRINPTNLTATTFEPMNNLSDEASANARLLNTLGVPLLHGVDATKLHHVFVLRKFDHIIFQFPHAGSREPIHGHNPNHILVRDFLKSAAKLLSPNGSVLITTVNSPHYHGAFQFELAAEKTGFQTPEIYVFDPDEFPGYTHTMTHQEGSAIEHHDEFYSWVFTLK